MRKSKIENLFLESNERQFLSYNNWNFYKAGKIMLFESWMRLAGKDLYTIINSLDVKIKNQVYEELQRYTLSKNKKYKCRHSWSYFKDDKKKICVRCWGEEDVL